MENEVDIAPISGACERDIDLLLLEEFTSSPAFLRWFASRIGEPPTSELELIAVQRSRMDSTGESDLEIAYAEAAASIVRLLIENKVSAGLQPRQADRYRERGTRHMERGECERYRTVLIAPRTYLGQPPSLHGFDRCVAYEDVRDWFLSQDSLGRRRAYKAQLLQDAIDRAVLGYQPVADHAVTMFWHSYWELALSRAPEIEMQEPGGKPAQSTWMGFRPRSLPPGTAIMHKLERGAVDLQIAGMGRRLSEVRDRFGPYLAPDMSVKRASGSAAIRIGVSPINASEAIQHQREAVLAGLEAALRLLELYRKVHASARGS